jgi:NTE family protein
VTSTVPTNTALVLGGGGLKGFAHIGVLRALGERGIKPALFAGTSIGSLIAAAVLGGMSLDEMEERALRLRKRDLFRINHLGMVLERMRSPSLYLEEPLRRVINDIVPDVHLSELSQPLLVNTVDIERGTQIVWGLPGLADVSAQDAVYASCALPGFYPPGYVGGRVCVDGGVMDNMAAGIAAQGRDAVIAVDVGSAGTIPATGIAAEGFATIYMRAATLMMRTLQAEPLANWITPPMLLVRPRVGHLDWFSFSDTRAIIDAGYAAAVMALDQVGEGLVSPGGVYPRKLIDVIVDRDRCNGCAVCVSLAPRLMALDSQRKAYAMASPLEWSPADGTWVDQCPTGAISVREEKRKRRRTSVEREVVQAED